MKISPYFFVIFNLAAILIFEKVNGQAPSSIWGVSLGEPLYDELNSITVDPLSGDVYTIGFFSYTIDFDPGPGTFNLTSFGNHDVFITKFNEAGLFIWAKNLGGAIDDNGHHILFDSTGNGYIYIAGSYKGTVDFDPGEEIYNMNAAVSGGNFISKLDTAGNFIWAKSINGDVRGMAIDQSDTKNIYLSGVFRDSIDGDPGNETYYLYGEGPLNAFAIKLTALGEYVWAKQFSGLEYTTANSIAIDPINKDVYITGSFDSTVDFDPDSVTTFYLSAPGIKSYIFILKLSSAGNFVWAHSFGNGFGWAFDFSLVLDPGGESSIYTLGWFAGTVDFNPDSIEMFTLSTPDNNYQDQFILKLNGSGDFVWAKSGMGGPYLAIDTIGDGNLYTTGSFIGIFDFDPGPDSFKLISSNNNGVYYYDMFISKFDTEGDFEWTKTITGSRHDFGRGLSLDMAGHIYLGGIFESPSISFDNTTLFNTSSNGTPDIFISKFNNFIDIVPVVDINTYKVNIYPIPSSSEIVIRIEQGEIHNMEITLFNNLGEVVYYNPVEHIDHEATLDIGHLIPGIYFIRLVIEGKLIVQKIIKE